MACNGAIDFWECVRSDGVFTIEILVFLFRVGTAAAWSIGSKEIARQAFLFL